MNVYYKLMLNAVQSSTAYRFHTFVTTFQRLIGIFVQISLWTALYKGAQSFQIEITQASLQEMWMYVVYSSLLGMIVINGNIYSLSDKIQTGHIVTTLIRPIGLFRSLLFETLGSKVFMILFEIIPVLIVSHFVFGLPLPQIETIPVFMIMIIVAFTTFFLMTFIVGMSSFWYIRTFHLEFMLNHVMNFFSGLLIPLWFFPRELRAVMEWLPFDLVYYAPLSVLLGKAKYAEIGVMLAKGCVWIALLAAAAVMVWHLGKRKLVIQGG